MKFAVIGTSWITSDYISSAIESGFWELSAVYSRSYEKGLDFAKNFDKDLVFTDINEFAKSDDFSAVYVASPNKFHYEQSKILLENGKHVICEKPITTYSWQLEELTKLANEKGLIYMEAIMCMHQHSLTLLKESADKLGAVSLANIDFCQRSSKYDAYLSGGLPNIFNPEMETGALMDLGIYCLYPILYLFGEPDSFKVEMFKLDTGIDAIDLITFIYSDKLVSIHVSKIGQSATGSDIQGAKGRIFIESISQLTNMHIIYNDGTKEQVTETASKTTLMGNEASAFYRFISDFESNKDFYHECQSLAIKVNSYLEKIRIAGGLPF